jgi:hypothetical protein
MIQAVPEGGVPGQQQRVLLMLRATSLFLVVPLFGAIVFSPIKHGLEEYELFVGFWALMALPLGVETAWVGTRWRRVRQVLGISLMALAIASLIAVIGWVAGTGPTGLSVLTLLPALVVLALACLVLRLLNIRTTPH